MTETKQEVKKEVKKVAKKDTKKVAKPQDNKAANKSDSDEEPVKLIASKGTKAATKPKAPAAVNEESGDDLPDFDDDESEEEPPKKVTKKEVKKVPIKKEVAKVSKPAPKKVETKPKAVAKKEVKKQTKKAKEESDSSIDLSDIDEEDLAEEPVVKPKKEVKASVAPKLAKKKVPVQEPEKEEEEEEEEEVQQEDNEEEPQEENKEDNEGEAKEEEQEEENNVAEEGVEEEKEADNSGEKEVFVGNLPFQVSEAEVTEFFAYYGPVASVKLISREGRPSGNAIVTFKEAKHAAQAVTESGVPLNGRPTRVRFASDNPAIKEPPQGSTTIFIGGLAYTSTPETVAAFFSGCGQVIGARVATTPEGEPKGFAHVEFDSEAAVQNALQLSGQFLDGRRIRIDVAASKSTRPQGNQGYAPRPAQSQGYQRPGGYGGQRNFPQRSGNTGGNVRNKGTIQNFQGKKTTF